MTDFDVVIGPSEEQVANKVRLRAEEMAADVKAMLITPHGVITCYNRCMWCGRRTRHEWCHQCSERVMKGGRPWTTWHRFSREPEQCEHDDDHCPVVARCNAYLSQERFS